MKIPECGKKKNTSCAAEGPKERNLPSSEDERNIASCEDERNFGLAPENEIFGSQNEKEDVPHGKRGIMCYSLQETK